MHKEAAIYVLTLQILDGCAPDVQDVCVKGRSE